MTTTVTAQIQMRRGTAAQWTSANPTLALGEFGYETDTDKLKIGDGATAWTALAYYYDPNEVVVTDHGALTGLSDDDHSQYHTDARGDLRYAPLAKGVTNGDNHDHSGGDGAQIAYSSLSGLPTLGTAAATAATDYAVAAKGVTNGDSHDHSGGDGAQISYSTLSNLPTLGTAAATAATDYATASHNHSGTYEPADATLLRQSDVDDTPVNGVTTAPVSSNWAYDHAALTTAHGISLFGSTLVDDASALAARTTLGVPSLHGFEGRTGSSLSLTGAVLTLTVTAQTVWLNGVAYSLTSSLTCDLGTPTVGLHYIAAQDDGTGALELVELVGAWSITNLTYTPVAVVYWNGSAGVVHEERHGHTRNLQLHSYLHQTVGARIANDGSFAQTRPTTVNDGQIELVAGALWDEDIQSDITTAQGKLIRNWYETASGVWTFADGVDNSGYDRPYIWNGSTSLLQYPNSGSSYALTDVASGRFVALWVYATNDITRPIYVVTPSLAATYSTLANARAATAPVLPFAAEAKLLYRWIYRGDGQYQEAADYRTASSLPSGGVSAPVAASVVFSPSGTIAATNVQAAIEELDSEVSAQMALAIPSDTTGITGADAITNIVSLTAAEYAAITPSSTTLYVIVG